MRFNFGLYFWESTSPLNSETDVVGRTTKSLLRLLQGLRNPLRAWLSD